MFDLLALTNVLRELVNTVNAENKKELLFFLAALFLDSSVLWNGAFFQANGTSQAKQSKRLESDR
jgi:hypothetical protein